LVLVLLDFQKQRITGYDFSEEDQIQKTTSPGFLLNKLKEPAVLRKELAENSEFLGSSFNNKATKYVHICIDMDRF
jgi:hypothetical protein